MNENKVICNLEAINNLKILGCSDEDDEEDIISEKE